MKKKIVFVAHDPGGLDTISPVYEEIKRGFLLNYDVNLFTLGPSGEIKPDNNILKKDFLGNLNQLINDKEIVLLITGTSWDDKSEIEAIKLCNRNGIHTISILDYWSNYIERFTDRDNIFFPNDVIVMDQYAETQAIKAGIPQQKIKVLGHPGLDKIVNSKKRGKKQYSKKRILFISQPLSKLYGNKLGYTEEKCLNDIIKLQREINGVDIFIKFHPKDDVGFKDRFLNYSVEGTISEICYEYDIVIGISSMALLHTSLLNIPTISYQPNLQLDDLCISNLLGLTSVFTSYFELKNAVDEILSFTNCSCKLLKPINESKIIWLDGRSTERVSTYIKEVLMNED